MKAGADDATVVVPRVREWQLLLTRASNARRAQSGETSMAVRNLTERVEVLEMNVGLMEELPARVSAVESQIVQLRTEMRGEFSAVRQQMRTLNEETRAEMRMLHEEVLERISKINEGVRTPRKRRR